MPESLQRVGLEWLHVEFHMGAKEQPGHFSLFSYFLIICLLFGVFSPEQS